MNETLRIQISAYVDGELSETESELLIRRMSQDPELRELADSYMSIGRALRREPQWAPSALLRDRVSRELGADGSVAAEEASPPAPNSRLLRPLAGAAIAAGVAVMALLGLQQIGPATAPELLTTSNDDLTAVAIDEVTLYTEPPVAEFVADRPSATLAHYYQQHNERAADIGGSGIFTRLVELELRGGELVPAETADRTADAEPAEERR